MALWGWCGSKSIVPLTAGTLPGPPVFPSLPLPPLQSPSLCLVETNQVFMGFGGWGGEGMGGPAVAPTVFVLVLASPGCQSGSEEPGNMFLQAWAPAELSPPCWVPSLRVS